MDTSQIKISNLSVNMKKYPTLLVIGEININTMKNFIMYSIRVKIQESSQVLSRMWGNRNFHLPLKVGGEQKLDNQV